MTLWKYMLKSPSSAECCHQWNWALVYISLKKNSFICTKLTKGSYSFHPFLSTPFQLRLINIFPSPASSLHGACIFFQLHNRCLAGILASTQNFLGYICLICCQMLESNIKSFTLYCIGQKDSSFRSCLIVSTVLWMSDQMNNLKDFLSTKAQINVGSMGAQTFAYFLCYPLHSLSGYLCVLLTGQ